MTISKRYVEMGANAIAGPEWKVDDLDRLAARKTLTAVLADIEARIEAHYSPLNGDVGPSEFDEGLNMALRIVRDEVS